MHFADEMTSDLIDAAHELRHTFMGAFSPTQNVCTKLRKSLNKLLPENIHILATGKLHLSVTDVYSGQNVIISNFKDKAEVIEVRTVRCGRASEARETTL